MCVYIYAAQKHYIELYTEHYFPGDPIKIPTVDDEELERARWFEVRLIDPGSNSLTKLEPNVARVTILDNDGKSPRVKFQSIGQQFLCVCMHAWALFG